MKNIPISINFATKENIENLKKFGNNIAIVAGMDDGHTGHHYSIEFDADGNVILHEPHNSQNGQKMTIDEFLKLTPSISFVVL